MVSVATVRMVILLIGRKDYTSLLNCSFHIIYSIPFLYNDNILALVIKAEHPTLKPAPHCSSVVRIPKHCGLGESTFHGKRLKG
jgi:hypothetical protein